MLSEQEKNEMIEIIWPLLLPRIIALIEEGTNKAVEKTLLLTPEVIGNLMAQQSVLHKLNREFYTKYPEFNKQREAVASVIEKIEGENPLMKYEDILKKAPQKIKERINTMKNLDMNNVSKNPNRSFEKLDAPSDSSHGEL